MIWEVTCLVAGRVEAEIALPATRGAFTRVLRNMVNLRWICDFGMVVIVGLKWEVLDRRNYLLS